MKGLLMVEYLYHRTVMGFKTQTRRAPACLKKINEDPDNWEFVRLFGSTAKFWEKNNALNEVYCKARFSVGEVVFVKETVNENGGYMYDLPAGHAFRGAKIWKNKMFMPEESARLYLQITGIRVERLHDISDEDCLAEGILKNSGKNYYQKWMDYTAKPRNRYLETAKESFFSLFNFANKKKGTPANVWCFVYDFQVTKKL